MKNILLLINCSFDGVNLIVIFWMFTPNFFANAKKFGMKWFTFDTLEWYNLSIRKGV